MTGCGVPGMPQPVIADVMVKKMNKSQDSALFSKSLTMAKLRLTPHLGNTELMFR
jgi:hypothetical protein